MKRLFTIMSALLITAGLKAQNSTVKKETSNKKETVSWQEKSQEETRFSKHDSE